MRKKGVPMRLNLFVYTLFFGLFGAFCQASSDSMQAQLLKLGLTEEARREILNESFPEYQRPSVKSATIASGSFHNMSSGTDFSGSTGLIELPTAFVHRPEYTTISGKYLFARGSFRTRGDTFNREKSSYLVQGLHGLGKNTEIGLGQTRLSSDMETLTGTTGLKQYRADTVLNTLSLKCSFGVGNLLVALGGNASDISAEDQILIDVMDNERLNSVYVAISEDFGSKLLAHFVVRNSFFRGSQNRVFMTTNDNTISAGMGLEYHHNKEFVLISELKKTYSEYLSRPDDMNFNVGIRFEGDRMLVDMGVLALNDSSSTSYYYGLGYRF